MAQGHINTKWTDCQVFQWYGFLLVAFPLSFGYVIRWLYDPFVGWDVHWLCNPRANVEVVENVGKVGIGWFGEVPSIDTKTNGVGLTGGNCKEIWMTSPCGWR